MDKPTSISTLQALRNTFVDQLSGTQAKIDALDLAFDLLKNGYQSDQVSVDKAIADGIAPIQTELDRAYALIATLQAEKAAAQATATDTIPA